MIVVRSHSRVWLFVTTWTVACRVSVSLTISRSLPKFMSIALVMPSSRLILWCPLLLPSIFPSIRDFSNESAVHIRWPKYWSFSFSISLSNEYSGLISLKIDWFNFLAVQGTLRNLLQDHSSRHQFLPLSWEHSSPKYGILWWYWPWVGLRIGGVRLERLQIWDLSGPLHQCPWGTKLYGILSPPLFPTPPESTPLLSLYPPPLWSSRLDWYSSLLSCLPASSFVPLDPLSFTPISCRHLNKSHLLLLLLHAQSCQLFETPWTVAHQAPQTMGILQARILEWVAISFSRGSSQPRDRTHISYISWIGKQILYHWATWEAQ